MTDFLLKGRKFGHKDMDTRRTCEDKDIDGSNESTEGIKRTLSNLFCCKAIKP